MKVRNHPVLRAQFILGALLLSIATAASATTVIPATDASLFERSDVVVHGRVLFSYVEEAVDGTPVTVTEIEPLEVFKGGLGGNLVLHQAGGVLPDGRFFNLWGRPEFQEGTEVVVFAISRPEGQFQTAEMLLGKFEVWKDEAETKFAVAPLHAGAPDGVTIMPNLRGRGRRLATQFDSTDAPRELTGFADYLRNGARGSENVRTSRLENLSPIRHDSTPRFQPDWMNLNSNFWRYSNNATAGWYTDGTANMSGGGVAETQRALATWNDHALSTINFTLGGSNPIHLNAMSSPCGWSTALPVEMGVIGCGGPRGSGTHSWRGETYSTITGGEVWLRAYSSLNQVSSVLTESILLHELGHTLGLGHSDQGASSHDTCRGDESTATMRSTAQNRTTLGTDDHDAIRWLYGDGGTSCAAPPPPPPCTAPSITAQPQSRTITAGSSTTLSVTATDAAAYQWYVGPSGTTSSPIAGATGASLTVAPAATTTYWVRVTNTCGGVNSAAATVTVTAPTCTLPSIFNHPASVTIERGTSTTLTVAASNATSYQWYIGTTGNTSQPISGANGSSLTVTPSGSTNYWVRATNSCGSANSSTATVTVYRNKRNHR